MDASHELFTENKPFTAENTPQADQKSPRSLFGETVGLLTVTTVALGAYLGVAALGEKYDAFQRELSDLKTKADAATAAAKERGGDLTPSEKADINAFINKSTQAPHPSE